jgi:putative cardiolipin synthase
MESRIGELSGQWFEPGETKSGFYPIASGTDSLGLRLRLLENADATIDLQYFLMKPDLAGILMTSQLLRAADRGVRIRFLLDDIFTSATDAQLAILDSHPNIEVRLFNPLVRGFGRWTSFVWNARQSNRRMHNKSFTVDNIVTIVGGRNIADEYFEIEQEIEFADFDIIGVGQVAVDVSASFDQFWNSPLAVPLEAFIDTADVSPKLETDDALLVATAEEVYSRAVNSGLLSDFKTGTVELVPANATVITDPPEKLTNPKQSGHDHLITALVEAMEGASEEIIIISPYFVPGKQGVKFLQGLREKGIEITVITNSLASNNHTYVHGGYAPRRKPLLASGVELHEAMANPAVTSVDGKPVQLTLHTKLVVIDRRLLFVGSLNIDPRSIVLNSEMGLLIDIPEVAGIIPERIQEGLPLYSYRVILDEKNRLRWIDASGPDPVVLTSEPDATLWMRFIAGLVRFLPIEGQL